MRLQHDNNNNNKMFCVSGRAHDDRKRFRVNIYNARIAIVQTGTG